MSLSTSIFDSLPVIDEAYVDALLQKEIDGNHRKIIVLDDDPTGVQTVHDISVFTNWDEASVQEGFLEPEPLFYILTNSRGFTREETTSVHKEIAAVVDRVAKKLNMEYMFISRSDSTLRGHYPLETEILKECYEANTGKTLHGEILCPFFKEGGRLPLIMYITCSTEILLFLQTKQNLPRIRLLDIRQVLCRNISRKKQREPFRLPQ